MTDDIFPDCRQDSPRLAWMKKLGIEVIELPSVTENEEDEFGNEYGRFNVHLKIEPEGSMPRGCGPTIDEALADFAGRMGIPLWNETDFAAERKQK